MTKLLLGYLLGINVLAFLLYGFDKWKAKKNKWRIPEKTKHWSFKILIPVFLVLHVVLIYFYCTKILF